MEPRDRRLITILVIIALGTFIAFFDDDPCRRSNQDEETKQECAARRHAITVYDGMDVTGGIAKRRTGK